MSEPIERMLRVTGRVFLAGVLILLVLILLASTAQAQDCPTPGPENHTYVFADSLDLAPGDTLRAEMAGGQCAGQAVYPDAGSVAMPVMGQTQQGDTLLTDGDPITFFANSDTLALTEQAVIGDAPPSTYTSDALTVVTGATVVQPPPVPVTLTWATDAVRVSQDTWRVALDIGSEADLSRVSGLHIDVQGARSIDIDRTLAADTIAGDTLKSWSFGTDLRAGTVMLAGPAPDQGQTAEVYIENAGVSMDEGDRQTAVSFDTRSLNVTSEPADLPGDVTGDGQVTRADLLRVVRGINFPYLYGLSEEQREAADIDGDGAVTQYDVWQIFYLTQ